MSAPSPEGALADGCTFRRLGPDDAAAVSSIRSEMIVDRPASFLGTPGEDPGTKDEVNRERLAHPFNCVLGVFDESGALLATATMIRDDRVKLRHKGVIVTVYTRPAARRRGYQRVLLAALIDYARATPDMDLVQLSVSATAPNAQALYESLGFVAWGREPRALRVDGHDVDEIHMTLPL